MYLHNVVRLNHIVELDRHRVAYGSIAVILKPRIGALTMQNKNIFGMFSHNYLCHKICTYVSFLTKS